MNAAPVVPAGVADAFVWAAVAVTRNCAVVSIGASVALRAGTGAAMNGAVVVRAALVALYDAVVLATLVVMVVVVIYVKPLVIEQSSLCQWLSRGLSSLLESHAK